jgi:hypothetical protein
MGHFTGVVPGLADLAAVPEAREWGSGKCRGRRLSNATGSSTPQLRLTVPPLAAGHVTAAIFLFIDIHQPFTVPPLSSQLFQNTGQTLFYRFYPSTNPLTDHVPAELAPYERTNSEQCCCALTHLRPH